MDCADCGRTHYLRETIDTDAWGNEKSNNFYVSPRVYCSFPPGSRDSTKLPHAAITPERTDQNLKAARGSTSTEASCWVLTAPLQVDIIFKLQVFYIPQGVGNVSVLLWLQEPRYHDGKHRLRKRSVFGGFTGQNPIRKKRFAR